MKNPKTNLLFICSRNRWRSPTGEAIWRNHAEFNTRSAGTSQKAKKTVSSADVHWADIIFVMENKHKKMLLGMYSHQLHDKPIHVLDIPDEYQYMEPELVAEITSRVTCLLS